MASIIENNTMDMRQLKPNDERNQEQIENFKQQISSLESSMLAL